MKITKEYLKNVIQEELYQAYKKNIILKEMQEAKKEIQKEEDPIWQQMIMNQEFVDLAFNYLMDLRTGETTGWRKLKQWLDMNITDDRFELERIRKKIKARYTPYIDQLAHIHPGKLEKGSGI